MSGNAARFVRLGVGLVGLVILGCVLTGQAAKPARQGIPLPTDWSHSHLIFSQPNSVEQLARLEEDPRFEQQLYRRYQALRLPAAPEDDAESASQFGFWGRNPRSQGLWQQTLGAGATVGAGNFPAKFSFSSGTASCASDFVVFSTGLTGTTGGQATIAAFNNLYTGCTAPVPAVYWAYNTGGQILTSPVFSRDGSQIAFAQTSGGLGYLVILKWKASNGTVGASVAPTSETPATYFGCTAPCMTTIALEDGSLIPTNDVSSSVFYNYGGDIAWVGDSRGWLHQFTGVFLGTPAEVRTATAPIWPVQMNAGGPLQLASAVYDHGSGNVFVGDQGGFFYEVNATTAVVTKSAQVDFGTGIVAGPIVDSSIGVAYVFSSNNNAGNASVYRFKSGFAAGSAGAKVSVGATAATPKPLYEGALDSAYESSGTATGALYVCGHTGGAPTLYRIAITAGGVLGAVRAGPAIASATTACSPVIDVLNPNATGGPAEWIFASVQASGTPGPCAAGGCIMNFRSLPWTATTGYSIGQEILDTRFQVEVATSTGTSAAARPPWSAAKGTILTDGTVTWLNQGAVTAATPATWLANHVYAVGTEILDTNNNIQLVTAAVGTRTSGASAPTFSTVPGITTTDNTVTWTNAGSIATWNLSSTGGTSGMIIDNTVTSGVSGSQIYFSTLGNQPTCGATTNVGCATQASQSALK